MEPNKKASWRDILRAALDKGPRPKAELDASRGTFAFDPGFVQSITAEQRRAVGMHERLHVVHASRAGSISPERATALLSQIDRFERGVDNPLVARPTPWDEATDYAINSAIKDLDGYKFVHAPVRPGGGS